MAKTAIPVDTQWLIDTLAKNDEVHDNPDGTVTDAGNVTTQLEQETQDAPETSSTKRKNRTTQQVEKQTAPDTDDNDRPIKTSLGGKEVEEQNITTGPIASGVKKVGDAVAPAVDKVSSLSTVGGVGLLVLVLVILLFVVVQVNAQGDTRMKQLWYMINGRATLQGRRTIEGGPQPGDSATGASGNFPTSTTVNSTPTTLSSLAIPQSFRSTF